MFSWSCFFISLCDRSLESLESWIWYLLFKLPSGNVGVGDFVNSDGGGGGGGNGGCGPYYKVLAFCFHRVQEYPSSAFNWTLWRYLNKIRWSKCHCQNEWWKNREMSSWHCQNWMIRGQGNKVQTRKMDNQKSTKLCWHCSAILCHQVETAWPFPIYNDGKWKREEEK